MAALRKAHEMEAAIREALFQVYGIVLSGDSLALARAALTAVRIPNNKMLDAASKSMSPGNRPTQQFVSNKAKHAIRYRAMIDVVLADAEFEARVKPRNDTLELQEEINSMKIGA